MRPLHLPQKFLIVLTGTESTSAGTVNEAIQLLWLNQLIDAHILSQDDAINTSWMLSTYLPYQNDCNTPSQLRIETFTALNSSTPMDRPIAQVYPKKLTNFHKCPLYVAHSTVDRGNLKTGTTIDGRPYPEGPDFRILDTIAENLNFSVVYIIKYEKTERGLVPVDRSIADSMELVFFFLFLIVYRIRFS